MKSENNIDLTLRQSHMQETSTGTDIRDLKLDDIEAGQPFQGYVRRISKQGCFVSLGRATVGRIILRELSDEFVTDPASQFPVGKLVSGTIISVDVRGERIELSMRTRGAAHSDFPN